MVRWRVENYLQQRESDALVQQLVTAELSGLPTVLEKLDKIRPHSDVSIATLSKQVEADGRCPTEIVDLLESTFALVAPGIARCDRLD